MKLKDGDIIHVTGLKSNKPGSDCETNYKGLVGIPTKVVSYRGSLYLTHPTLYLIPFESDCIEFKIMENVELGSRHKVKRTTLKEQGESEEPKLSRQQEKLLLILTKFQEGDIDLQYLEDSVGGLSNFLKLLGKNNLLTYIDPFSSDWGDYQNQLFYAFYQNDSSFIWKIVDKYLSDVTEIGGDYYYDTSSDELAGFFNTNYRSEISSNAIESILGGEYDMNFWDVTDNVYRDVYDELTPENKKLVNERIVKELKDMETIDTHTELLEEIAEEQGREDVELTEEVISRILNDDDTIEYLINKEFDDIRSDLYNIYASCYEGILGGEWYDSLMDELTGFVIDNDKRDDYSYKKQVYDKEGKRVEKTFYGTRYKATNCIYDVVSEWLEENKNCEGYCDTIEYFGNYNNILSDLIGDGVRELLRVPGLDEYPDHRKVEKCVNGSIRDYF